MRSSTALLIAIIEVRIPFIEFYNPQSGSPNLIKEVLYSYSFKGTCRDNSLFSAHFGMPHTFPVTQTTD